MHHQTLKYLKCVKCNSELKLDSYKEDLEIIEGMLSCVECGLVYPIISGVAILWNDFANYLANRQKLGGELLLSVKSSKLKSLIKSALGKASKDANDLSIIEKRWTAIYQKNQKSRFYYTVKKSLDANWELSVEYGCSIGVMSAHLAKHSTRSFGVDKSFYAIVQAKKTAHQNLDYIIADSLEPPFGKTKFDLVLGLNLFELIEPKKLLKILSGQIKKNGTLVLSDPYDFERGAKSIKEPLYSDSLRKELTKLGFTISNKTKKPSFIAWDLKLHERAKLQYLVDLVIAKFG